MTDFKHIITPERTGLWVAASFIIALLALVLAIISMQRLNAATYLTQLQIVQLNQKIEANKNGTTPPATTEAAKQ